MIGTRDLQTTMLEGYGMAPLNLNMSAINNKSMFGKAPLLRRTMSKKTESKFFITSQKGGGGAFTGRDRKHDHGVTYSDADSAVCEDGKLGAICHEKNRGKCSDL